MRFYEFGNLIVKEIRECLKYLVVYDISDPWKREIKVSRKELKKIDTKKREISSVRLSKLDRKMMDRMDYKNVAEIIKDVLY